MFRFIKALIAPIVVAAALSSHASVAEADGWGIQLYGGSPVYRSYYGSYGGYGPYGGYGNYGGYSPYYGQSYFRSYYSVPWSGYNAYYGSGFGGYPSYGHHHHHHHCR